MELGWRRTLDPENRGFAAVVICRTRQL